MKKISPPPLPREHGAWGIIGGAFLAAIVYSKSINIPQVFLLVSILFFYISRVSFFNLIRGKRKQQEHLWFPVLAMVGWLSLLACAYFSQYWMILLWSLVMLPFLIIEILLVKKRKQMSFLAQLLGTIGLTTLTPLTLILHQQKLTAMAVFLWIIVSLFFISGILFVRYQISAMKNTSDFRTYHLGMIIFHLSLLLFLFGLQFVTEDALTWIIAFTPMFLQNLYFLVTRSHIRSLRKIGWLQIGHMIIFLLVLTVMLKNPPH